MFNIHLVCKIHSNPPYSNPSMLYRLQAPSNKTTPMKAASETVQFDARCNNTSAAEVAVAQGKVSRQPPQPITVSHLPQPPKGPWARPDMWGLLPAVLPGLKMFWGRTVKLGSWRRMTGRFWGCSECRYLMLFAVRDGACNPAEHTGLKVQNVGKAV